MLTPEDCPVPVALPFARLNAARTHAETIVEGADLGYALVKYIALARVADWVNAELPGSDATLTGGLSKVLSGASADHWVEVASVLERLNPAPRLPATPAWADMPKAHAQNLNTGRRSRHSGREQPDDPKLARQVRAATQEILAAAEPILALPFVRFRGNERQPLRGPRMPSLEGDAWSIGIEAGGDLIELDPFTLAVTAEDDTGRRDVYVYERLSQRGVILASEQFLFEREGHHPTLARLVDWVDRRRVAEKRQHSESLAGVPDEELRKRLRDASMRSVGAEWRASGVAREPRPEADSALALLGSRTASSVLFLTGPSGIGKTRELIDWIKSTPRLPLWIRAATWKGEDLPTLLGTAAAGGAPAVLDLERIQAVARDRGLALAVDGINETADPEALATALLSGARDIGVPVHLVITTRREALDRVVRKVDPSWIVRGPGHWNGVLELGPLPQSSASALWSRSGLGERLPFDRLPPATRRLLQIPLMAALAIEAAAATSEGHVGAGTVVQSFVEQQTVADERVLLRHLATLMFREGVQVLDRATLERSAKRAAVLLDALAGEGELARPLRSLIDKGLVRLGSVSDHAGGEQLTFAHDRLLQWFASHWLVAVVRDTPGELTGPDGDGWGAALERVARSPALCSAIGQAIAALPACREGLLGHIAGNDEHARTAARLAVRALAEDTPDVASSWLNSAWERTSTTDVRAREELVALAGDVSDAHVLTEGLRDARLRGGAIALLTRVRPNAPEVVFEALEGYWQGIAKHPWLHPREMAGFVQAMLFAQVAEGAQRSREDDLTRKLADLTRAVARGVLGTGRSWYGRAFRRALVESLCAFGRAVVAAMPKGPVDNPREVGRFFRLRAADREVYRPLVELYAGRCAPEDAREAMERAATQHEVGAVVLMERALIMAALRPETSADTLNMVLQIGGLAQGIRPVPMAAQSVLYVYSNYLEKRPSAPDWDTRFAEFEKLLDGWLVAAPRRRWTAGNKKTEYKSLFAAAHSGNYQRRHGTPSPRVAKLWDDALNNERKDLLLAEDLLDDLMILAISRGAHALALAEVEPLLAADWLPKQLMEPALKLLAAVGERDPELLQRTLSTGSGVNRGRLAATVQLKRARDTAGYAIMLDFDDVLVLNPAMVDRVARMLGALLDARTFQGFLSRLVREFLNGFTGDTLFPELLR